MASAGNLADLDEAARLLREAIATLPQGDPTRKSAEHNLANTAKLGNLLR